MTTSSKNLESLSSEEKIGLIKMLIKVIGAIGGITLAISAPQLLLIPTKAKLLFDIAHTQFLIGGLTVVLSMLSWAMLVNTKKMTITVVIGSIIVVGAMIIPWFFR
ncbi:MAG TPA: hypothetical protein VGE63_02255 [Candidatus Paceibacterota bacterium]